MYDGFQLADLYQNPRQRPRFGYMHAPTLTRGCKRIFLEQRRRYAHGLELMLWQGIPVTAECASAMDTVQVEVESLSRSQLCSLAGNAMHSCCIGMMCLASLFVKKC